MISGNWVEIEGRWGRDRPAKINGRDGRGKGKGGKGERRRQMGGGRRYMKGKTRQNEQKTRKKKGDRICLPSISLNGERFPAKKAPGSVADGDLPTRPYPKWSLVGRRWMLSSQTEAIFGCMSCRRRRGAASTSCPCSCRGAGRCDTEEVIVYLGFRTSGDIGGLTQNSSTG